jgi:endosialidase-like protein
MHKFVFAVAALLALTFVDPAWSITQGIKTNVETPNSVASGTVTFKQTTSTGRTVEQKITVTGKSQEIKVETDGPVEMTTDVTYTDGRKESQVRIVEGSTLAGGRPVETGIPGVTVQGTPSTAGRPQTPTGRPTQVGTRQPTSVEVGMFIFPGFYFGLSGGWSSVDITFTPYVYRSINVDERTENVSAGRRSNNFNIGGFVGFRFSDLPVAVQLAVIWLNSDATIDGLPGNQFAASMHDSLRSEKDWMVTLTGLYLIPGFTPDSTFYVEFGLALVHDKFTHNCAVIGWCGVSPATAPFSASDSQLNPGLVVGVGWQFRMPWFGDRIFGQIGYQHIFVQDYDVLTGSRAVRQVFGRVDQDIDRFYLSVLMALGGPPVSASDIRLKRDIALVGRRADGIAIYRYRYLWSDTVYVGVMAQEIAESRPDAVLRGVDGFLRVDYGKLGTRLMTWDEWSLRHALAGNFAVAGAE